jgi:glycosyltransferase involved in cell wall biosynthesis
MNEKEGKKKRICFVVAVEITIKAFMVDHIRVLQQSFDISVVVNTHNIKFLQPSGVNVTVIPVKIERKIVLFSDVIALIKLYHLFRKRKFDIIHSITPKAGLLAMVAGVFAHIPIRIHTFTGQVWATRAGVERWFLKTIDRLLVFCATNILVDSHSQKNFLVGQRVVSEAKAHVIADGSICGVDAEKFSPNPAARKAIRDRFHIHETDITFLFLGRRNRDKGLLDLAKAFSKICSEYNNVHLLVVGPDEEDMKNQMIDICESCSEKVHFEEYTDVPEQYMAAADVFCLPSYREGFGIVIIEAASVGIPSIGSRIYGVTDAIEDGVTGYLFETGNPYDLASKMREFIESPALIKKMGREAMQNAGILFSKEKVTTAMLEYYQKF